MGDEIPNSLAEVQQAIDEVKRQEALDKELKRSKEAAEAVATPEEKIVQSEVTEHVSLPRLIGGTLDRVLLQWKDRYMTTPWEGLRPRQQRETEYPVAKLFLHLPMIGAIVPSALDRVSSLAGVGSAALGTAGWAGILGMGARVAIDGIRWSIGGEKTIDLLAREMVWRGTNKGKSMDSRALFRIVFGDRADVAQLVDLQREVIEAGVDVANLGLGKDHLKRLIRIGLGHQLDRQVFNDLISSKEQEKLDVSERTHLADVDTAYQVACKLFEGGLSFQEKIEFLEDELPRYLERREFTNHLKAMAVRSGIAGFKASIVGAGATILRGVFKIGAMDSWIKSATAAVEKTVGSERFNAAKVFIANAKVKIGKFMHTDWGISSSGSSSAVGGGTRGFGGIPGSLATPTPEATPPIVVPVPTATPGVTSTLVPPPVPVPPTP